MKGEGYKWHTGHNYMVRMGSVIEREYALAKKKILIGIWDRSSIFKNSLWCQDYFMFFKDEDQGQ